MRVYVVATAKGPFRINPPALLPHLGTFLACTWGTLKGAELSSMSLLLRVVVLLPPLPPFLGLVLGLGAGAGSSPGSSSIGSASTSLLALPLPLPLPFLVLPALGAGEAADEAQ